MLYTLNFNCPFILETDASGMALVAVLTQKLNKENRPVIYASGQLEDHETWYATIEWEYLTIKWEIIPEKFYLLGQEFTLIMDHAPRKWLEANNAQSMHGLWPHSLTILKYQPRKKNVITDFFSQQYEPEHLPSPKTKDRTLIKAHAQISQRERGTRGLKEGDI